MTECPPAHRTTSRTYYRPVETRTLILKRQNPRNIDVVRRHQWWLLITVAVVILRFQVDESGSGARAGVLYLRLTRLDTSMSGVFWGWREDLPCRPPLAQSRCHSHHDGVCVY